MHIKNETMKHLFSLIFVLVILSGSLFAQEETQYKVNTVAFYNVENLFDTINDPDIFLNEEFSPESEKQYDSEKYYGHLNKLAEVISKVGADLTKQPPVICGVSEVENETVLTDLVNTGDLKKYD